MRHGVLNTGKDSEIKKTNIQGNNVFNIDFVLEKSIFSNIFEKDIRRVFIYKKAERLAKAIHLIAPAFLGSASLKSRIDGIAMSLIDAATLPPNVAYPALSREILALSSVLSIARTSNILSPMNVELISREAHILLQEVAAYEAPRLSFDETPTLSSIAKEASSRGTPHTANTTKKHQALQKTVRTDKGQIKDKIHISDSLNDRRESIVSVIRDKTEASIKDISTLVRDVSEKTIQRELSALIASGVVLKRGERRWSTYSLA